MCALSKSALLFKEGTLIYFEWKSVLKFYECNLHQREVQGDGGGNGDGVGGGRCGFKNFFMYQQQRTT